jgi:NAD+ kinase
MKVAIYSRGLEQGQEMYLVDLLRQLQLKNVSVLLYTSLTGTSWSPLLQEFSYEVFNSGNDLGPAVDCLISLGGDGTMLDCATLIRNKHIPLLGINFGRLGFLANIGKEEIKLAVDSLLAGNYIIDQRTLIHAEASIPIFADSPFALNEFVIHKKDVASMIKVHTYLNGEFLNTYWCDGLIVSTPTGSTGYNLSCNGPILFPECGSFVITPIAPHHLNVRPIVVPDNNIISFEVEARSDEYLCSMDARREMVPKHVQVAVRKESFTIGLMRFNEYTFLETLRNKLTWGLDKRNP